MPDPIKTQVMNALAVLLAEIEGLGSVKLEVEFPFDLNEIPEAERPALFIWDDSDAPEAANLMTRHDLSLTLALFLPMGLGGFPAFAAAAEILAAQIYNKLTVLDSLRAVGMIDLMLGTARKAKAQELWGEMVLPLRGDYAHAAADACSLNLS